METAIVGRAAEGFPLHIDAAACAADHVLVCGRVKPHTSLAGDFQSGLLKMLLIGLGKQIGANIYHRAIEDYGFDQIVRSVRPPGRREVPRRGGAGDRGKRLRRNGPDRGRRAGAVRGPRDAVARRCPRIDGPAAVRRGRRAGDRPHRQEHQRRGLRSERGGPQVQRPPGRRRRNAQGETDLPPQPDARIPRQRRRPGDGRVLPHAVAPRHGPADHAHELAHQRPSRRWHDAAGLRNRPRDARRRPWGPSAWSNRPTPGCCGSPTRSTWPRWNVQPPIWKRPAGGATWRSSRSRGRWSSTRPGTSRPEIRSPKREIRNKFKAENSNDGNDRV